MAMVEYITDEGKEMLAHMLAGKARITFTKIQMGDGVLPSGQSGRAMTALVNPIEELEAYRTQISSENVVSVMGIFNNSKMESGFYFREKGVFASDGTDEILFTYANSGSSAEYINPPTVELVEKQIVSLYKGLEGTEKNVNISVVSGVYALQEDLEKHAADEEKYITEVLETHATDEVKHITEKERSEWNEKASTTDAVFTGTFSQNRRKNTASGANSFTANRNNAASGNSSFAAGDNTTASGNYSFTAGYENTASGIGSSVTGYENTASGTRSFATGFNNTASGANSCAVNFTNKAKGVSAFAAGSNNTAAGNQSATFGGYTTTEDSNAFAAGYHTTALRNQMAVGHYNNTELAKGSKDEGTTGGGTAFVVGNGISSIPSNACRITDDGAVIAKKAYQASGADYAERKEWVDGNPDAEDRRGYFVAMDGDKIKIASPGDFLLGVISANPCIIGNDDEGWVGEFEKDEFGDFIMKEIEVKDEETGEITKSMFYKVNPDYDPKRPYTHRKDRKEWDCVGMLGFLATRDDGTCQVNEYCTVTDGGIATASQQGYRVVERVNDSLIKILFR